MRAVTSATTLFMWGCMDVVMGSSFGPGAAVALEQGGGGTGAVGAGRVGAGAVVGARPALEDGLDPSPRGLDFVAAHEQGRVAAHDVHQEPLVGVGGVALEGLRIAQVERHRPQPDAAGA